MNIQNLNQQQNYLEKKIYGNPPLSEKEDLETLINDPSIKILYQNPETQEEFYSLNEKVIEGFNEYLELLEKDVLGHNETSFGAVDADASKRSEVIITKIKN